MRTLTTFAIVFCAISLPSQALEWRGNVGSRYAQTLDHGSSQLFEHRLYGEVEFNVNADWRFFGSAQVRIDKQDHLEPGQPAQDSVSQVNRRKYIGNSTVLELRELFVDGYVNDVFYRLGKQQVVWGQADGLRVLDVINPQSYREFIWLQQEQRRLPLWMANIELPVASWTAQLLWIPDQSYNQTPSPNSSATFAFSSSYFVPSIPAGAVVTGSTVTKPDNVLGDSDWGLRLTNFIKGWDLSINYLYHFQDDPIVRQFVSGTNITLTQEYDRSHLLGGSLSNAFGNFTLRSEVAYSTDKYFLINQPTLSELASNQGL